MRTFLLLTISAFTLLTFSLIFSSCKEDEPPTKPKLSFDKSSMTVNEGDGDIEIKIKLDKGAFEDITIEYELSGTALDKVAAGTTKAYDYEITSDYLEIGIDKGDSIGFIKLTLLSDLEIEEDETIIIKIKDVDSENIEITRNDDITIKVKQENGMVVALEWGVGTGEKYTDVDMDLFLWAKGSDSNLGLTNIASANSGFTSPEFFFLPTAAFDDGPYGLSCNYYEGTVDPMNFRVSFVKFKDGAYQSPIVKKGAYKLANVNPWFTSDVDPILVQTFDKANGDFTNFSDITIPATASRIGSSGQLSSAIKKGYDSKNKSLPALQKLR
ncbi:MAG: hypothetical protein JJE09_13615 [Bacteroidia bacterium]|nr:hypothetical protein [Bacteroidia bacterium]